MTPATRRKREQLRYFIERVLEPEPAVQAVIGIGSIASGRMRPDSDIDAIVFLDPMDWYVIPGEFIWRPSDGSFHSIFTEDAAVLSDGLELDCRREHLKQWADPGIEWPEGRRAELSQGWIAFDRYGRVRRLVAERTDYPDSLRQRRLDEAVTWLDQHLGGDGPAVRWGSLGPAIAFDRLSAACDSLVAGLFAYNRTWRPWRNRQMDSLLMLEWLPDRFEERILVATSSGAADHAAYMKQAGALKTLFGELLDRLSADGIYTEEPIGQAFIRGHDEPGYAWNMDEWNADRARRSLWPSPAAGGA
ncbi:MAG: nucleotidyltransferase domain-containing protein [Chloroflexota bacterium]|nr:MAG: nucleotidyltransferase domain-containing protein [Chloroflexota bacterium]